jgi:hypothetical protein
MPLRNAPHPLPTTLRLMASRLFARRSPAVPDRLPLSQRVEAALEGIEGVTCCHLEVPAGGDWVDSGWTLQSGETVSVFAEGRVWLAKALDIGFGPTVGLWHRVGEAPLAKLPGVPGSLIAPGPGRLRFITKPPGEFATPAGTFEAEPARKPLKGGFRLSLVRWPAERDTALVAAANADPALFDPVLERLAQPRTPPPGWHYLWRLGEGEIFRPQAPAGGLCCHTAGDVGILQHPVDLPFSPETRLDWDWCVRQLPSALPEHTQPTHDYLSIAVEFDNGLDLTYLWSVSLPVDTIFQCPLPWWDQRETHWVIRSGRTGLGQWQHEQRRLWDDYRRAIGEVPPARIVAVWLIANSAFQRGVGDCEYRDIRIGHGGQRVTLAAAASEVPPPG